MKAVRLEHRASSNHLAPVGFLGENKNNPRNDLGIVIGYLVHLAVAFRPFQTSFIR